jgi:hypothetical protein
VLALACASALAQAPEERMRAMANELEQLKKRVEALEVKAPAAPTAATPSASSAPAGECPSWDELRMSLTQEEVRALLGAPPKVEATPLQTAWIYPCGTAYFDNDTRRFVGYRR